MSLSKEKNRERMRLKRVQPSVQPKPIISVQPKPLEVVQPKLKASGLVMQGNRIVGITKHVEAPKLPLYNPAIHRPGDRVLVQQGKRFIPAIVPTLDADGQFMPELT